MTFHYFMRFVNVTFLSSLVIASLSGQQSESSNWNNFLEKYKIKTSLGFQLWSTYTIGQERYDPTTLSYQQVDDRWNLQLRRSRLSITGQAYKNLKFKLTAALDLIGRDANSATQGGNNFNGNFGHFSLWNMYIQWQPTSSSDLLHVTSGFLPPQIGRESITAALKSTSYEKSWSQNYLRRSIVGKGPGRAMGINIGGQKIFTNQFTFSYDVGIFSPQVFGDTDNSQGIKASPLLVGRIAFHFGQPESETYGIGHRVNYFGKRNGFTVALASSYQGNSDLFDSNLAYGLDWLFNHNNINIDGEWTFFERSRIDQNFDISTTSNTGYCRIGYNIILHDYRILEPVVKFTKFNGAMNASDQIMASELKAFYGKDQILDIGANLHINPKLKVSVSYVHNAGDSGDALPEMTNNNFFINSNKNPIQRGDLLGMALVAIF